MRAFRKRTSYRLLTLFFIAAIVYMMFQVFSINILSLHNKLSQKHEKRKYLPQANSQQQEKKSKETGNLKTAGGKDKQIDEAQEKILKVPNIEMEQKEPEKPHQHLDFHNFKQTLHGVHPDLRSQYDDHKNTGQFKCLRSQELITTSQVNDDYCDCDDGTDEPGTSACQNNRFYCAMQLEGGKSLTSIGSSFVNDGICDCCDGSDEWQGRVLPDSIRIKNPLRRYPVNHAPCKYMCQELEQQAAKLQSVKKMGLRLKQDYIKEAVKNNIIDKKYGSQGEFYRLSQNCFDISHSNFEYKVFPFVKVTQTEHGANHKKLGGISVIWLSKSTLKMEGGDSAQCPEGRARTSIIEFACGLQDKLLTVRESSMCEYSFTFTSPAAC